MKYIKLFENFEDSIIKIINWEDANQAIPINSYFKIILWKYNQILGQKQLRE